MPISETYSGKFSHQTNFKDYIFSFQKVIKCNFIHKLTVY